MSSDDSSSESTEFGAAETERRVLLAICEWMITNLDMAQEGRWYDSMPVKVPAGGFQTPIFARLWDEVEDLFTHWPAAPRNFFFRWLAGDVYWDQRERRLMIRLICEILKCERPPEFLERVYKECIGEVWVREDEVAGRLAEIIRRLGAV